MVNINILRLRHYVDLTQTEFAESINIKKGALQSYETARANPPLEIVKRIVDKYNITDLYSFLFGVYDQNNIS